MLTARYLLPMRRALFDYLLALRLRLDLPLRQRYPAVLDRPYPLGRCREITTGILDALHQRLAQPATPMEHALAAFLREGGIIRPIWGALRGRYFQNAMQFGGLYVDCANDTVTITKPKVEIMPLGECGLEPIRGTAHFAQVASLYWEAPIYANHVAPALAPVIPFISHLPGMAPKLEMAADYMLALFMRDGFHDSEQWLRDGPPPPPDVVSALLPRVPADLRATSPEQGRAAAIVACQTARAGGHAGDMGWRHARVLDYLRTHPQTG